MIKTLICKFKKKHKNIHKLLNYSICSSEKKPSILIKIEINNTAKKHSFCPFLWTLNAICPREMHHFVRLCFKNNKNTTLKNIFKNTQK